MSAQEARASAEKAQTQQSLSYIRIFVYEIHMNPTFMLLGTDQRAEVVGVYTLALLMCLVVGYVPEEPAALARLLNVSEKVVQRSWPLVSDLFITESGRAIHPRIHSERLEILRISEARKQVARKRWGRGLVDLNSAAGANTQQLHPEREEEENKEGSATTPKQNPTGTFGKSTWAECALPLVEAWNRMAIKTGGALVETSVLDLPHGDLDRIIERLGGFQKVADAINRIAGLPFYQGAGANGWKASLPWLLQRKSLASLLAQTPPQKSSSVTDSIDLSEVDRALLDQLQEDASAPQGRLG